MLLCVCVFRPLPEEDVDGREMSEEEGLIDDSTSQDGRDSRNERTPRSGEMSEERRQKLREIEVRMNSVLVRRMCLSVYC